MAEDDNTQSGKPDRLLQRLATHYTSRVDAAKFVFSGELEERRKDMLAAGDVPWRILRYERIVDPEKLSYPIGKNRYVRPRSFEMHLEFLKEKCTLVSLEDLFSQIESKAVIADNTVAVTLDGGWVDNFIYAAPLLKRHNVPATMFLPPYFIGTNNYPWQEKVVIALIAMKNLGGKFIPFTFCDESDLELLAEISPEGEISLELISRVVAILTRHTPEDRLVALSIFGNILALGTFDLPTEPAFMSWEEVGLMHSLPVTFGALTNGNALCHELEEELLSPEISDAFAAIERHTKKMTRIFAFPEGILTKSAYDTLRTLGITRAVGIDGIPAPAMQTESPLLLGRTPVIEGAAYAKELFACLLWSEPGVIIGG